MRAPRAVVPPDGQAGFMGALLNGVAGILSEPIRYALNLLRGLS